MANNLHQDEIIRQRISHLEKIDFFSGLHKPVLIELAVDMKEIEYKKNSIIINQGDNTRSLFILLEGRIKVTALDEDGHQTVFSFLDKDDYFGELSLLDDAPRSATITALEDTHVLQLAYPQFQEFIDKHPDAVWSLFKALTHRIRDMDDTICTLTSKDIYGRLVARLYKEAKQQDDGSLITERLTHQDLAEMIGSSREMISRIFKELKKGGYIKIVQKHIHIMKKLPSKW